MKMRILSVFFIVMIAVQAETNNEQWTKFKTSFNKNYLNSVEERLRFNIFQENMQKIEAHNKKYSEGLSTFKMGINQFADLTAEEFQDRLKLSKMSKPSYLRYVPKIHVEGELPAEFDWRTKGAVTEVKDQGSCGSCWTFSTTGTVEAAYFFKTGKLVSLSEQNLIDCADTCYGCDGGWMDKALEYVKSNGLNTESEYPYEGVDDNCRFNRTNFFVTINDFAYVEEGNEAELQKAVAVYGPVAVAIDATWNFQFYGSGILDDDMCGNVITTLNHGVLVVGYGTENNKDFWIVKNSWGSTFGEKGYIRMSRNKNNQCGIATDGTYPV